MWSSSAFLWLRVVGPVQALLDVLVRVGVRRDVDALRLAQQVLRQAADVAGEGRAVHHRLARRRHVVGDGADVVDEAHVEHAVGFVEHQHLDVLEHGAAGLQVVEQAARRRDQDVERAAQRGDLRRVRHAADDGRDAQARHVAAVGGRRLGDLHRELARRRQHQDARAVDDALLAPLAVVAARGEHALQRRQDERRGLAAAGAGRDHQVMALQRRRNRLRLHFGGGGVAGIGDGLVEGRMQAQGFETHGFLFTKRGHADFRSAQAPAITRGDDGSVAGEKVRSGPRSAGSDFGNSQSDGIAANHSRKRRSASWVRTGRTARAPWEDSSEVRGDERIAANSCGEAWIVSHQGFPCRWRRAGCAAQRRCSVGR